MIICAAVAGLLASYSPFLALIFILAYGGKYHASHKYVFYLVFLGISLGFVFLVRGSIQVENYVFDPRFLYHLPASDVIFGTLLPAYLFGELRSKGKSYLNSILLILPLGIFYSFFRKYFFGEIEFASFRQILAYAVNDMPEVETTKALFTSSLDLYSKLSVGLWGAVASLSLYVGALLRSRRSSKKWEHRKVRLPFYLIYVVIPTLVLVALPNTRYTGFNLALVLVPVYAMQGYSILHYYLGKLFARNRIITGLMITFSALNGQILLLISFVGLFDTWFDFRKLNNTEEINEGHIS